MSSEPQDRGDESPERQSAKHIAALDVLRADYAPFGRWMDDELERLVARWAHLAAPAAKRGRRATARRMGR